MSGFVARGTLLMCLALLVAARCRAQSLRDCVERRGVLIGTAARPQLFSERLYTSTLAREFIMIEPEDAMKWWVLRPDRATFDFSEADRIVVFAEVHGMKVRGHTLVWGWSNPSWLDGDRFGPEQLRQLLQEHIAKVVTRYRGRVFAWDVVNEAFDENGTLKPSLWYDHPGIGLTGKSTAYIEQTLRWAHAADPEALLFYNDNGAEALNKKSDAIYAMVKDFKQRGVPINGVGMQMHIFDLGSTPTVSRKTLRASPHLACRCTSPKWMSRCRSTQPARQAYRTLPSRQRSTAQLRLPAWRTRGALPSRPGASLTNTPGSAGRPNAPRAARCSSTAITFPNLRTLLLKVRARQLRRYLCPHRRDKLTHFPQRL